MSTKVSREAWEILESKEFDSLLDAVALMAKAQGNLLHLQQSVEDLKFMMNDESDDMSLEENVLISDVLDDVEVLVSDLSEEGSVIKAIES